MDPERSIIGENKGGDLAVSDNGLRWKIHDR
jgi:hypothetical protein